MARMTPEQYRAHLAKSAPKIPPLFPAAHGQELREDKLQDDIEDYLKSLMPRCWYDRKRMDVPTTSRLGVPDFIGWIDGKPFALEVKVRGKKPTIEQQGELRWAHLAGASARVVYTLEEVVELIEGLKQ